MELDEFRNLNPALFEPPRCFRCGRLLCTGGYMMPDGMHFCDDKDCMLAALDHVPSCPPTPQR